MTVTSHSVSNDASKSLATSRYVSKQTLEPLNIVATSRKWFPALAKSLYPAKPVQSLAYYTNAPTRTCSDWVKGEVDPPARAIVQLIQSDQGWRVLSHLMRNSERHWWLETVRARELAHSDEKDQLKLPL